MDMTTSRRGFLIAAGASALYGQDEKPVRLAIIGTGHRAWAHIATLKTMPGFQVVALADPTPEFRDRAATMEPGAKTYSDYHTMLAEQKNIDAVVVIVPSFLHAEVTVAALNAGYPVLCEKPMATTVEDANRMIEASRKSGKILQIGFQKRFTPAHQKLKQLVQGGEIGKVEFVSASLFRGDWNPESWKYTDPKTGVSTNWRYLTHTEGSALLEDGIHELDVLNWIIDDHVARVFATGGNNVFKQRQTIDHAGVLIDYENGVKVSFGFCLFAPNAGPSGRQMVLIGSDGVLEKEAARISIRKSHGKGVRYVELPQETVDPIAAKRDPDTYQLYLTFAESLRTGKPPAIGGEAGKIAMKISLLAEMSLRERRPLNWTDLPA